MVNQTKLGAVEVLSGKDSGHIFEVVIDGLGIEFGEKRRVHDDSKIFDLSIWENWIAICWDGKLGREDQKIMHKWSLKYLSDMQEETPSGHLI